MKGWFVVRTHHQRESWAVENLLRQGATVYLPRIAERARIGRNRTHIYRPKYLFPGYVFVKTDGQWRFLLGTYGIAAVIMQSPISPGLVPDPVIDDIRAREDQDGLVILPDRVSSKERFRKGEQVRVASGVYSGYIGIYDGTGPQDRERVLLDFLGRKTRVLIGSALLESVD